MWVVNYFQVWLLDAVFTIMRPKKKGFMAIAVQRSSSQVHFAIQTQQVTWNDTAKKVALFVLKIVLFPWALYELSKYVMQRVIMLPLYPAQSSLLKYFLVPSWQASALKIAGLQNAQRLNQNGYQVTPVRLEKNGNVYSGFAVEPNEAKGNGNWVIQATGNGEPVENSMPYFSSIYKDCGFSTLLINGPGVGLSEGRANPETMGDAQEVGLCYLESALKAKNIVMAGRSLGGAAMSQAILQHTFKPDVKYMAVRQMTFDRVSHIAADVVAKSDPKLHGLIERLIKWAGCEIDSVEASKRLSQLNIEEIIIQARSAFGAADQITPDLFASDGVITKNASLGFALANEKVLDRKHFYFLRGEGNIHMADESITMAKDKIAEFGGRVINPPQPAVPAAAVPQRGCLSRLLGLIA